MNKHTFRCSLGKHEYSKEAIRDKHGCFVRMCIHCKLHGYYIHYNGIEVWSEYYPNGYRKRAVFSNGDEKIYHTNGYCKSLFHKDGRAYHYNKRGVTIYSKHIDSTEEWLHKGKVVREKPENWDEEYIITTKAEYILIENIQMVQKNGSIKENG